MTTDTFIYAFADQVDKKVEDILVTIPSRWGRMPPLSRAVVVEAGKTLQQNNILPSGSNRDEARKTIGLIGGTRYGSLTTDLAFTETLKNNIALASPAIFGYTLANIPLAEAANQFNLTGPVYAVIDHKNPFTKASKEARRLLATQNNLDLMLACEFDSYYHKDKREQLSVTFTLIGKND